MASCSVDNTVIIWNALKFPGKIVYKNQCSKCHQHQGEGVKIGPDMTGMAAHPKKELLIHILDPNRDVEGNFRQYVVSTKGGKILTGMLASETKSSIELIDTEAKKQAVLRDDIDEILANLPVEDEEKGEALRGEQEQSSSDEDSKSAPNRRSSAKKRALPMGSRRGYRARDDSAEFQ